MLDIDFDYQELPEGKLELVYQYVVPHDGSNPYRDYYILVGREVIQNTEVQRVDEATIEFRHSTVYPDEHGLIVLYHKPTALLSVFVAKQGGGRNDHQT
jgi:hypothetical protein